MQDRKRLIRLAKRYSLDLFILFGSRAKGQEQKESDYDFAFYTKKVMRPETELELMDELIGLYETEKIDLVNINTNTDVSLRKDIFLEGELIYESSSGLFEDLAIKAWMDYVDFKPFIEERERSIGTLSGRLANG